jgi:hypothetical protein
MKRRDIQVSYEDKPVDQEEEYYERIEPVDQEVRHQELEARPQDLEATPQDLEARPQELEARPQESVARNLRSQVVRQANVRQANQSQNQPRNWKFHLYQPAAHQVQVNEEKEGDKANKTAFNVEVEPISFEEALNCPSSEHWKTAMDKEMKAMKDNEVWNQCKVPPKKNIVETKWIYKIKHYEDEKNRYKARLVAKGFTQRYGVDYEETFAPTAKAETVRLLMAIAAQYRRKVKLIDINTAFLTSDMKEEVYIRTPDGKTGRLLKSLYGCKQSGRNFFMKLKQVLIESTKLKQSTNEPCLFIGNVIAITHVDDILYFGNNNEDEEKFEKSLESEFKLKKYGEAKTPGN